MPANQSIGRDSVSYFGKQYNEPGTAPGILEPDHAEATTAKADLLCYTADRYQFQSDVPIDEALTPLAIGQVSLFLGKNFVVSIDDAGEDIFEPVRLRLETSPSGRIRSSSMDYLFYALVDLVDSYRDMSGAVMELLLSTQNRQLNETMRMLTVFKRKGWF